ncbi:unnamed protein product, partial [Mesorhabditis spiculigera]
MAAKESNATTIAEFEQYVAEQNRLHLEAMEALHDKEYELMQELDEKRTRNKNASEQLERLLTLMKATYKRRQTKHKVPDFIVDYAGQLITNAVVAFCSNSISAAEKRIAAERLVHLFEAVQTGDLAQGAELIELDRLVEEATQVLGGASKRLANIDVEETSLFSRHLMTFQKTFILEQEKSKAMRALVDEILESRGAEMAEP